MALISSKLKHAWNAFNGRPEEPPAYEQPVSVSYSSLRPDRTRIVVANERSLLSSILTQMSVDVAAYPIRHVRLDHDDRFVEEIDSGLNYCLRHEANIDQAARALRQDIALTLFDKGVAAVVPVETSVSPNETGGYDIRNLRVGEILSWYPEHVQVRLYNEKIGRREDIVLAKRMVAIVENPLYSVMNEPNSTLQRLILKLGMLDTVDKEFSSGKLDLLIQLPYVIKSEARRQQAEQRRTDIEFQLRRSQYGIAYTDATEKVVQLNRPVENNLLEQVEYLTKLLYTQLGINDSVMNGTADEKTMTNYMNRTIEPVLAAITEAMSRAFLTKTARSQKQLVMAFTSPFRLVPVSLMAELADKFTRNEILTSNEVRQLLGMRPALDPKADQLRNSNMPHADEVPSSGDVEADEVDAALAALEGTLDSALAEFGG